MKFLFVVNEAQFFVSHRLSLGLEAQARGHEVLVASAANTGEEALDAFGLRHIALPLSRSGFNVFEEFRLYRALCRLYRLENPHLVHHVTSKPIIYGSFAARRTRVGAVVNAVPGMGLIYSRRGWWSGLVRACFNLMYRLAFAGLATRVIFQNTEDLKAFVAHGIVRRDNAVLIRGSGVDLTEFAPVAEPPGPIKFVMLARMLREKGVVEFAMAAKALARRYPDWQFVMAGATDPGNPSSLSEDELSALERECGVSWIGRCDAVPELLASAHVVCLPTYYREGLPKSLLEAAAAGRGIVATDIAGCREVVTNGVTGLLVTPRSIRSLVKAMECMGVDELLRRTCGQAARRKAEAVFGVDDVVNHHFRVYEELLVS